jgi:hypothetical protein
MLRRIDAPLARAAAEHVYDLPVERDLLVDREVAAQERVVDLAVAQLGDERHELGLDLREDLRHAGRLHLRLEVVEEDVVWLVLLVEAVDVLHAQLDVALEQWQEELEVRRRLRLAPDRVGFARGARHLGPQLGGHAHGFRVFATREAQQPGIVRVGVERALDRLELVEQPADLRIGRRLVREAREERDVVGAVAAAAGRHDRPLVPREQEHDGGERVPVGQAGLELLERVGHGLGD